MIFIASDHGGFELKKSIVAFLEENSAKVMDLGAGQLDTDDDYPDYAAKVADHVLKTAGGRGILICRNGVGMSMAANKIKGIRCALSWAPIHAASSRNDDDTNVLALPSDYIDTKTALDTVSAWLATEFGDKERYNRRLKKLAKLEGTGTA